MVTYSPRGFHRRSALDPTQSFGEASRSPKQTPPEGGAYVSITTLSSAGLRPFPREPVRRVPR